MNRVRGMVAAGVFLLLAQQGLAQMTPTEARDVFREIDTICTLDGGKLWGVPLGGPWMIVNPATREAMANRPDPEKLFKPIDGIYVGKIPNWMKASNGTFDWNGTRWMLLRLPLPADDFTRNKYILHELWHGLQNKIGLPATPIGSLLPDTPARRAWLRLEALALRQALASDGDARTAAVEDALLFRAARHALPINVEWVERAIENNEGLAEYTGIRLASSSPEQEETVIDGTLNAWSKREDLSLSFGFAFTPAYGFLLDRKNVNWREGYDPNTNIEDAVAKAYGVTIPDDPTAAANERAEKFDGKKILQAEVDRASEQKNELRAYRETFVDGPALIIPLRKATIDVAPGADKKIEGYGTVYTKATIHDEWGTLTVDGEGVFVDKIVSSVRIPVSNEANPNLRSGDGWKLDLRDGWEVTRGLRVNDLQVRRRK